MPRTGRPRRFDDLKSTPFKSSRIERELLDAHQKRTGLSKNEIVRQAVRAFCGAPASPNAPTVAQATTEGG